MYSLCCLFYEIAMLMYNSIYYTCALFDNKLKLGGKCGLRPDWHIKKEKAYIGGTGEFTDLARDSVDTKGCVPVRQEIQHYLLPTHRQHFLFYSICQRFCYSHTIDMSFANFHCFFCFCSFKSLWCGSARVFQKVQLFIISKNLCFFLFLMFASIQYSITETELKVGQFLQFSIIFLLRKFSKLNLFLMKRTIRILSGCYLVRHLE